MDKGRLAGIFIDTAGKRYCVVPEEDFTRLTESSPKANPSLGQAASGFGEWIKFEREQSEIQQLDLANQANITQTTLSRIETGEVKRPHKDTRNKLTAALEELRKKKIIPSES